MQERSLGRADLVPATFCPVHEQAPVYLEREAQAAAAVERVDGSVVQRDLGVQLVHPEVHPDRLTGPDGPPGLQHQRLAACELAQEAAADPGLPGGIGPSPVLHQVRHGDQRDPVAQQRLMGAAPDRPKGPEEAVEPERGGREQGAVPGEDRLRQLLVLGPKELPVALGAAQQLGAGEPLKLGLGPEDGR